MRSIVSMPDVISISWSGSEKDEERGLEADGGESVAWTRKSVAEFRSGSQDVLKRFQYRV